LPRELHDFIIQRYVEKRRANIESKAGYAYTTPRTLLSIIRLAQAMARIRWSDEIDQNDIDEALRLMDVSQISVLESLEEEETSMIYHNILLKSLVKPKTDVISAIFSIITDMCRNAPGHSVKYSEIEKRVKDPLVLCNILGFG